MRNPKVEHDCYQPMPETKVKEIKSQNGKHFITVTSLDNEDSQSFEVSCCAILIGSRPDLKLLNNVKTCSSSDHIILQNDNLVIRTLKRFKFFCEKCRHMNLCLGLSKTNLSNTLADESTDFKIYDDDQCSKDDSVGLCEDKSKALDGRNPLSVNKFSNELLNVQHVYALGPLVGDNFVRFISGGSLLVCSVILKEKLK